MMPALLVLREQGLRFLSLLGRKHSVNLGLGALSFNRQIGHELRLLVGEGAYLRFVETGAYAAGLGQAVLTELLAKRLHLGRFCLENGLDLRLLGISQIQLRCHALEHLS